MPTPTESCAPRATAATGKYLTFRLGAESFGVAVLKIREIIRFQPITRVPDLPACVKGVINLRGRIIPVIDLRLRFGLADIQDTESTCIMVVQTATAARESKPVGLVVDSVEEVVNLAAADLEPTPDFGSSFAPTCLLGMAKIKGAVKTLLDIDRTLDPGDWQRLATL